MPTFTHTDVIRIFRDHLDPVEQARVRDWFKHEANEPEEPPIVPFSEAAMYTGMRALYQAHRNWHDYPSLDDGLAVLLAQTNSWGNVYRDFIEEYNINEYIETYKEFYDIIDEWEAELTLILNLVATNPILRLFRAANAVNNLFTVLEGVNTLLNAIQLVEDIADDLRLLESKFNRFETQFELARSHLGFWRTFRGSPMYPGTNTVIPTHPVGPPPHQFP